MKLYLLRHGKAENHHPGGTDAARELTEEGIREMRQEAKTLAALRVRPDAILTSPYARARQTADIVAEELGLADRLESDDRLACGFSMKDLRALLSERTGVEEVMLVGHNPDLAMIGGELAGGAAIDLKKGGLIRLDAHRLEAGGGILEWVLTPAMLGVKRDNRSERSA